MPPITNTLETTRRLEGMGFAQQQARGLAELFEETGQATQQDLKSFIANQTELIRSEMKSMEERLRAETRGSEDRLHGEIARTKDELRAEFHRELRMQLFWLITAQAAIVATYVTLAKLFLGGTF